MSYLSISHWRDGHGYSKYLRLLFFPACLNAGMSLFITGLPGKLPTSLGISHQNHSPQNRWPNPASREGFNHIKSSAPSIRLACCHGTTAGEVKADAGAAELGRGPGIPASGTARSRSFPIPNGNTVIPPSQQRVPL